MVSMCFRLDIDGYPATVNNYPECTALVRKCAAPVVGAARSGLPQKTMGAEDFSYFLEERPGESSELWVH